MEKIERKVITILVCIIAICAAILIYKIKKEPMYDKQLYDNIYEEYDNIFSNEKNSSEENEILIEYKTQRNVIIQDEIVNFNNNTGRKSNKVIGKINIPKINIKYPIIGETTDEYLKIAPTKIAGGNIHEIGNFCIIGHNYNNDKFFSKLKDLEIGDMVILTDSNYIEKEYKVFNIYKIREDDWSFKNQDTGGKIIATLITCTKNKKERLIVECEAKQK